MSTRLHAGVEAHPRGQALVEFALAIPLVIILMLGIVDLGRAIYTTSTLNNAAREGARQAIVDQTESHVRERAASQAVALGIDPGDVLIDYRLAGEPESAGSCNASLGSDEIYGCVAVVAVPYDFSAVTPIIGHIVGPISMVGEARFPVSFNCVAVEPTDTCPLGD